MTALLEVRNLKKHFSLAAGLPLRAPWASRPTVRAVDGVSFSIAAGETVGLVGESGCGKSTTAQLLLRLLEPTEGDIQLDGVSVTSLKGRALRSYRSAVQAVFQNPYAALSPRMKVGEIIAEPLIGAGDLPRDERNRRVIEALELVGLEPAAANRLPHEFSGGQRQRIAIARGLVLRPKLVLLDEPLSALDVSIRAQILNLLQDLQDRFGLSYLLISHDLETIAGFCDRIVVMYLGQIVESGEAASVSSRPQHPYTQALFSATLGVDPDEKRQRIILSGEIPSPLDPPAGCRFHTRCPIARPRCASEAPLLKQHGGTSLAACHFAGERIVAAVGGSSSERLHAIGENSDINILGGNHGQT
jgi:oligopeptide/dipeptide ABC transporter ATP-binding protein